ncbi:MAG: potassium transporter Kup [Caldilineaceae bacterium]|nr:potassium transporter Kup [Caldilineaceae bacterium]
MVTHSVAHGATSGHSRHHRSLALLALGALGVVYGDIGTSPLYAFRESFHQTYGIAPRPENVLGILSLIFWALITIISVKYLVFVLRADNQGEGGILALTALVMPKGGPRAFSRKGILILLGLFGTSLLYGDGIITPAISVLSAVEGLEVATPFFQPYIVPITLAILVALFLFQSRGTAGIAKVFGPITLLWFLTLATLGLYWVIRHPTVLVAVDPRYGAQFFAHNGWLGFLVLGSIFLVVTGGEALYADMGHFGKAPIRAAWFVVALPSLLLNYFGQGALLLIYPDAVENPFYEMAPEWALYPVVIIATLATIIASQALITGAFSLTMQAIQLSYLPRLAVQHTSSEERGQIYIPAINWLLMISCIALVLAFQSSSNLAAAYGVAVTTTMVVTTLLLFVVQRELWKWPLPIALIFTGFFLTIDLSFWAANLVKIPAGGWFPLMIGILGFTLMTTWKRGRELLAQRLQETTITLAELKQRLHNQELASVPGTAVYMSSNPEMIPPVLLHNIEHNKALHDTVIFLSVIVEDIPRVPSTERIEVHNLGEGFYRINLYYGFMDRIHIPRALTLARTEGLAIDASKITFFLGREHLLATERPGMALWRERLFAFLSSNSRPATDLFRLPADRVVELGAQIEL